MSKIRDFFKKEDVKSKAKLFNDLLLSDDKTIMPKKSFISEKEKKKLMNNISLTNIFGKEYKEENIVEDLFNNILELPDIIEEKEEVKDINNVVKEVKKKTNNHKEEVKKDELFDIIIKESLKTKKDGLVPDPEVKELEDINSLDLSDTDKLMNFLKKLLEQINLLKKQPRQYASGGGGGVSTTVLDLKWSNVDW